MVPELVDLFILESFVSDVLGRSKQFVLDRNSSRNTLSRHRIRVLELVVGRKSSNVIVERLNAVVVVQVAAAGPSANKIIIGTLAGCRGFAWPIESLPLINFEPRSERGVKKETLDY